MKAIFDPRYQRLVQALIDARKDAGLTQQRVASALRWQRTTLSAMETCQRRMDVLEVYALANLYGITLASLEQILAGAAR